MYKGEGNRKLPSPFLFTKFPEKEEVICWMVSQVCRSHLYFSFNRAAAFLKTASLRKRTGGSLFYFNLFHHLLLVFFKYRICYPFQWTHVQSPWPFNFQGNGSGGSLMPHFRRTGFFPVVRTGFQPAWEQSEFHQSGKRFHCHFKNDRVHQLE